MLEAGSGLRSTRSPAKRSAAGTAPNVNPLNFCFPAVLKYAIVILNLAPPSRIATAPPCAMDPLLIPTRLVMQQHVRFGRIAAVLPVKDIQLAKAFYVNGLNFEVVFENGDPVGFVILKREEAELHLTLQPQHKAAAFPIAHLLVDDANALYSRCQALGARIVKGIQDKDYGIRAFVFADPDGNRIDVGQIIGE